MRCPNCGFEMTDGSQAVCPRCGYALAAPPARESGASGPYAGWGAPPADASATAGVSPSPYAAPPSTPLGGQPYPYQAGPYGAPPSQPLAPGQMAPGGWPPPPPGYGAPGFGTPGQPSGYAPYGQAGPPSMPLARGQTYPQPYPGYPGYVPLPPKPARSGGVGVVVGVLVAVVVVAVGLNVLGRNGAAPSAGLPGVTPTPTETVLYTDSLANGANGWPSGTSCFERTDGYHVRNGANCFAPIDEQSDVQITVDARQISGATNYSYGIVLRYTSPGGYYYFGVDGYGEWVFLKCVFGEHTCTRLVDFTADPQVNSGLNEVNTLRVVAKGAQFTFYINDGLVGDASDAAFSSGQVGLYVDEESMEAVFTNLTITKPV